MSTRALDDRPMLVFFHDPACGHCRRTEGFMAQVLQRRSNHQTFRLRRVAVSERPELTEHFKVSDIPTLVVVDDGSVKAQLAKPRGCIDIQRLLTPWLK